MRIHTYTYYIHLQHLYLNLKWSFCTPEKRWGVAWASNPRVAGPWDTQLHRSDKCTIIGTWILTIQLLGKDHIESTISLICFFCQLPWIQPIWPKCWDPHAIVTPATVGGAIMIHCPYVVAFPKLFSQKEGMGLYSQCRKSPSCWWDDQGPHIPLLNIVGSNSMKVSHMDIGR